MFLSASPESLATVSAEQILSKLNLLPFLASHMPRTQTCFKPLTWEDNSQPRPNKEERASGGKPPKCWSNPEHVITGLRECRSAGMGGGGGFCSPTGSQVVRVLPTTAELDR